MNSTFLEDTKDFFIISFVIGVGGILIVPIAAFILFTLCCFFVAANFISLIILILGNTVLKPKPMQLQKK